MRKALLVLLCMILALTALVSCGETHVHTYEREWSSDAENHWHAATCKHTNEKSGLAAHVDEDGDEICDVCEYSSAAHHFATILSSDETGHWYACTDDGCNEKKDFAEHNDADRDGECDDCFRGGMHRHSWNTAAWQKDDTHHWNPAICGSDCPDVVADLKGNIAPHVDENEDGVCDQEGCGYDQMHRHTYDDSEWVSDETGHWYAATCEHDTKKGSFAPHVDEEGDDFVCDECGYVIHEHTYADELTQGDGEHYYAATCGHDVKKDLEACADTDSNNECDECGAHVHSIDDSEWLEDETGHWHATTCSHDPAVKADFAEHVDENSDNTCDECGFHAHTWATDWSGDANQHWHAATCPGHEDVKKDVADHVDSDSDTLCDICTRSTIGPIAGVNNGTWDKTNYTATPTGTLTITGDDSVAYTVTWKSYDVATYDATLGKMIISKKTVVDSIKNGADDVASFVKEGRTYVVGTVLDKSEQSWTTEVLTKITAQDAGISPNSIAFQFRTMMTVNGDYNSRMPDHEYNQLFTNLDATNTRLFCIGAHDGNVYLSVSTGWYDTNVDVGEEFAFAVRFDRVNAGGKTSYLMTLYVNGSKLLEKTFTVCPTAMTFKTYSATRDLELVMTDIYCDSYGIRYEGSCETTTTTVWEKDGTFSTTEVADGNKYDIEWYKSGAITTDADTGVVTSQDKRVAIKSIKDAEGNETTITWSGKTYKAGECYIPKGWLDLGTAFWGAAPAANFTATEALKTGNTLYEFKTTMTVNDYGTYAAAGIGNVLEMRLYSGNTQKEIVYFSVGGGPSRFIDWTYASAANGNARGKLQNTLEIRVVVTESAEAGKIDIAMYGKTQGTSEEALVGTKTVEAYDLTKIAFDAPSNARYQTTVFENTTFTKYVTELTPEPAPAE